MRTEYDVRLKTLRDNYSAEQYVIKRSKAEIAKTMLAKGYSENEVTDITGLTIAQNSITSQSQARGFPRVFCCIAKRGFVFGYLKRIGYIYNL